MADKEERSTVTGKGKIQTLVSRRKPSVVSATSHSTVKSPTSPTTEKEKKTPTNFLKKKKNNLTVDVRSKSESIKRKPASAPTSPVPTSTGKQSTLSRSSTPSRASIASAREASQSPVKKTTLKSARRNEESPVSVLPRAKSDLSRGKRPSSSELSPAGKTLSSRSLSRSSTPPLLPKPSGGSNASLSGASPKAKLREKKPSLRERLTVKSARSATATPRNEKFDVARSGSFTSRPRSPEQIKLSTNASVPPRMSIGARRDSLRKQPSSRSSVSSASHPSSPVKQSSMNKKNTKRLSLESNQTNEDTHIVDMEVAVIQEKVEEMAEEMEPRVSGKLGRQGSRNSTPSPIPMSRPSYTPSLEQDLDPASPTVDGKLFPKTNSRDLIPSPELRRQLSREITSQDFFDLSLVSSFSRERQLSCEDTLEEEHSSELTNDAKENTVNHDVEEHKQKRDCTVEPQMRETNGTVELPEEKTRCIVEEEKQETDRTVDAREQRTDCTVEPQKQETDGTVESEEDKTTCTVEVRVQNETSYAKSQNDQVESTVEAKIVAREQEEDIAVNQQKELHTVGGTTNVNEQEKEYSNAARNCISLEIKSNTVKTENKETETAESFTVEAIDDAKKRPVEFNNNDEEVRGELIESCEKKDNVGDINVVEEIPKLPSSPFAHHFCDRALGNDDGSGANLNIKPDADSEMHKTEQCNVVEHTSEKTSPTAITQKENQGSYLTESLLNSDNFPGEETAKGPVSPEWLFDQVTETFYTKPWSTDDAASDPCFEKEDIPFEAKPKDTTRKISLEDYVRPDGFTTRVSEEACNDDPLTYDPHKNKSLEETKPCIEDPSDESLRKKRPRVVRGCALCLLSGLAVTLLLLRR